MEKIIKVVVKKPKQSVMIQEIDNTSLADCYRIIDCSYCEAYTLSKEQNIVCLIDEEGKLKFLDKNFSIPNDYIVGTCIFASFDEAGNFKSLNGTQIHWIKSYLKGHSL